MSPRRFSGWEPIRRTWQADGYTVTRTEPEWDDIDQALVLAHLENEDMRCPGCGGYLDQTMSLEFGWTVHEAVCNRCSAHERHREAHPKPKRGTHLVSTAAPVTREPDTDN